MALLAPEARYVEPNWVVRPVPAQDWLAMCNLRMDAGRDKEEAALATTTTLLAFPLLSRFIGAKSRDTLLPTVRALIDTMAQPGRAAVFASIYAGVREVWLVPLSYH